VEVYPNQTLQLFSGIKSTQDEEIGNGRRIVNRRNPSGNFALGRDYYAARPIGDSSYDCNDNQENYYDVEQKICYQKLGSLSPITGKNFPGLGGVSVAQIIIKPDSIRAPHWHLQFAETGYCYEGLGQVGVIVPSHTIPKDYKDEDFYKEKIIEEIFLKPNEVFLFPEGSQHYLRNIGNEDFKCILFFAEGPPLNGDQLLSISLQNIVGNTPVGVLDSVFVANDDGTINKVSDSPAQNFSSKDQRSKVIPVVQACSGDLPNIEDPVCSPDSKRNVDFQFPSFLYSDVDP
jgi:mannose-6-phosphate isomerase-like protein (cupin superfamily)